MFQSGRGLYDSRPGQIAHPQNLWDASDILGAQILPCNKEKIIRSTNLQSNR